MDHFSPTAEMPHISMLTGLLANALGYCLLRGGALIDRLQDRLSATCIVRESPPDQAGVSDLQTIMFPAEADRWSSSGEEGLCTARTEPGARAYMRRRYYLAGRTVIAALTLSPEEERLAPARRQRADLRRLGSPKRYAPLLPPRPACGS